MEILSYGKYPMQDASSQFYPVTVNEAISWSALWGYVFGTAIIIGMGFFGFHAIKQMLNRKPQIIMTDSGLQTSLDPFHSWGEIMDVRIISRGTGRYQSFHLLYGVDSVTRDLQLDGLTMGRKKLDQLIRIYRGRFMEVKR